MAGIAIRSRDRAWHNDLMRRHWRHVLGWLVRGTRCRADAEDLAQQTLLTAWRKRDAVPEQAAGWLITTARYCLLNYWRAGRTVCTSVVSAEEQWIPPQHEAAPAGPVVALVARFDVEALLGRLNAADTRVLHLHYLQHLCVAEIAFLLGTRNQMVGERINRARQRAASMSRPAEPAPARPVQAEVTPAAERIEGRPSEQDRRLLALHGSGCPVGEIAHIWDLDETALHIHLDRALRRRPPAPVVLFSPGRQ